MVIFMSIKFDQNLMINGSWDVGVIGAGAAGSSTAFHLANAGI